MFGKVKKGLAIGMSAGLLVAAMAGCSSGGTSSSTSSGSTISTPKGQDITLTLWGSQDDQATLRTLADKFISENTDNKYTINLGVCGQDVAKDTVLKDVDAAADVFSFASDQLASLVSAGALMPVTIDTSKIEKANSTTSVQAAKVDGVLYGYPLTSNTYFLYYDKKYYSDSEVGSLETMMNKDLGSGVANFTMNMSTGWYGASFFMTAGATLFGSKGTDPTKCDYNGAKGLLAGKYMISLANQKDKFVDYGTNYDTLFVQAFQDRKLGAAVSGTWNATKIQSALGSDYAATKLPTIEIGGKATQMVSFSNFNLYGVNSHTKQTYGAMKLAEYLSGEDSQKTAFQQRNATPTNLTLVKDTTLLNSNIAAGACAKQTQSSVLQPSIDQIANFWTPMANLGSQIEQGKTTEATLQADLDTITTQILSKISS